MSNGIYWPSVVHDEERGALRIVVERADAASVCYWNVLGPNGDVLRAGGCESLGDAKAMARYWCGQFERHP